MSQQYLFGRALREHYKDFLDPQYNPNQIKIQSSYKYRTFASAYAKLMGLFNEESLKKLTEEQQKFAVPPNIHNYDDWIKELDDQTIYHGLQLYPVSSEGYDTDYLLESKIACPSISAVVKTHKEEHKHEISKFHEANKDLYDEIFNATGIIDGVAKDIVKIRNVLTCALVEGQLIVDEEYANDLLNKSSFVSYYMKFENYLKVTYGDYKVSKVMATPFLKYVKETLLNIVRGNKTEMKYEMYIASDTLLHAMLLQLNYYTAIEVPFSSTMFFELYKRDSGSYYIKVMFNKDLNLDYELEDFAELIDHSTYNDNDYWNYCMNYRIKHETESILDFSDILVLNILFFIVIYARKKRSIMDENSK